MNNIIKLHYKNIVVVYLDIEEDLYKHMKLSFFNFIYLIKRNIIHPPLIFWLLK